MKKALLTLVAAFIAMTAIAQNPCPFKYGATEEDSLKCAEQVTLFRTYYNQKQYEEAYAPFQYIVNTCPCAWSGTFVYGKTMVEKMIKTEKDSLRKERLIDTLIWSQTAFSTYHPDKYSYGKALGWKAYYTTKFRSKDKKLLDQAFDDFVTSVELEKENTQPAVWEAYFQLAVYKTRSTKDTTYVIEAYERSTEYIEDAIISNQEAFEKNLEQFDTLESQLAKEQIGKIAYDKAIEKLVKDTTTRINAINGYKKVTAKLENGFAPFANGQVLLTIYEKKFEQNKDDLKALKKMLGILSKDSLCRASQLYSDILTILHSAEPSGKVAFFLGVQEFQKKNYDKAISFFNEAISLYTTNEEKAQPYYFIATIESVRGSFSAARTHALEAARCNPKFGRPYILIGDMYRNSYNQFTNGGEGVIASAVYWAAADKYNKAQAVDPSLANECARKRAGLPAVSGKILVENNLQPGQSYHVGGWINENTTVR
jgi:tetratricopeptide (TPR) repeat protein